MCDRITFILNIRKERYQEPFDAPDSKASSPQFSR